MANAPDTSPYILAAPDGNLSNSRVLLAGTGLSLQDTGSEGTLTIAPDGNLGTLSTFASPGIMVYDAGELTITARTLEAGTGIAITNGGGQGANPSISVTEGSTIQQVKILNDGVEAATRKTLNLIPSGSVSITIEDNSLDNRADINIAGVVSAPDDATYILQTPNSGLTNAQPLNALASGILKVTTGTGVVSHAVADTDYQSASANLTAISGITANTGTLIVGTGDSPIYAEFPASSTPGTVLTSNGADTLPSWEAPATGNLTVVLPNPAPTPQPMVGNTTYIATNDTGHGAVVFRLPSVATSVPGQFYRIVGAGDGGWEILQNASQSIAIGSLTTTTGTGGSITTTTLGFTSDSITVWCVTPTYFVGQPDVGQVNVL